jgi:hypothetical protein
MYSYSQQSRCFWNGYNIAWPWRRGPSSGRTVPTVAVPSVRELMYQVIWIYLYLLIVDVEVYCCTWSHTLGRTPLDDGSARRRDLYVTTHNILQETDILVPGGIRTRNPRKRATADSLGSAISICRFIILKILPNELKWKYSDRNEFTFRYVSRAVCWGLPCFQQHLCIHFHCS